MTYLIGNIIICLFLASVFSLVIGWLLRNTLATKEHQRQLKQFTAQRDEYDTVIKHLETRLEHREQENVKLVKSVKSSTVFSKLERKNDGLNKKIARLSKQNKILKDEKENHKDDLSRLANEQKILEVADQYLSNIDIENSENNESNDAEKDPCAMGCLKEQLVSLMKDREQLQATINTLVLELSNEQQCQAEQKQNLDKVSAKASTDEPDDLQKIVGIGKANTEVLKAQGITCYAQIAAFSTEDEKKYGNKLGVFSARITQENWVEQAKILHKEKYGEEL